MSDTIRVKLTQSLAGSLYKHRRIVASLGLRKLGSEKELKDIPEIRGQIKKVSYMVSIVD